MTLIAITCQGDSAQILTDTAAYSPNLRDMNTTTKVHHYAHLDAAIAFGGSRAFGTWTRFAIEQDSRTGDAQSYDELVAGLPGLLRDILPRFVAEEGPAEPFRALVVTVGYSHALGEFAAHTYASDRDFEAAPIVGTFLFPSPVNVCPSECEQRWALEDYLRLGGSETAIAYIRDTWPAKPAIDPDIEQADLVNLAVFARHQRSLGAELPVHGKLIHHTLRRGRVVTRTAWTFPTTGPDFERFIAGTDHPQAQTADCGCGSGIHILQCCRSDDLGKACLCGSGGMFKDCCLTPEAAVLIFRTAAM